MDIDKDDIENDLRAVCRLCWLIRNVVLCIDEIWNFCQPGWAPKFLRNITLAGRHHGITVLYTAQRPATVANDILGCATRHHVFRVEPQDVSYLQKQIGVPAGIAPSLATLPDRQFFFRDDRLQWRLCK